MNLGISGRLTRATLTSPLTPLFLVSALAVGLLALFTIPREEEPQISVPMVDIQVAAPGFDAVDAAELVGVPLETIVRSVDGVEHVYTQAQDDGVLVTARFVVGSDPDDAAIRIEEKLRANWHAKPVGVPDPMVTVRGINDVPMLVLTLSPKPGAAGEWTDASLHEVATRLRGELAKVEDVGLSFLVGGRPEELRIEPDPARLAAQDVTLGALVDAVSAAQRSLPLGTLRQDGQALAVASGLPLASAAEIEALVLRSAAGAPVYLRDVADVVQGPREDQARAWRWQRASAGADGDAEGAAPGIEGGAWNRAPAVSLAIAKRAGANAVVVAEAVLARLETLRGPLLPTGLDVAVTRNYGETADEKANELLFHLALATISIVALVGFAIGWREAAVTAVVIPTTILLTLFASRLMGYTINRVSLFALIFSIGILVDDAIVMIENIARHWAMRDGRSRVQATIDAVAEVGNPTVVATLTVIAALLPMLFVSGLMGPYMAPIPVNASAAMLFSFFVAVVIAPWLMIRFARGALAAGDTAGGAVATGGASAPAHDDSGGWLGGAYARLAHRVIDSRRSARNFLIAVGVATLAACSLFYFKVVTVKLLPFDDKSEVQVVMDLPEGSSLEETARRLDEAAAVVRGLPEAESMEAYAGTAAPFNFNGLVRHYFLRSAPGQGDLMVRLAHRDDRDRASHDIALDLRERLQALSLPAGTSVKVVETPPGPPVMATLLAEIYGPDAQTRRRTAEEVEKLFRSVPYIVDVDNSRGEARPRLRLLPRRDRLEYYGIAERDLKDGIDVLLGGLVIGQAPRGDGRLPLPIRIALPQSARGGIEGLAATPMAPAQGLPGGAAGSRLISLGELVEAREEAGSLMVFRRDGRAAELVTAELAGAYEAPVYGLLAVNRLVRETDWGALGLVEPQLLMNGQPEDESRPSLLWDGEWEITWVTFRDMGAAFGVALFGIYILVVAQFRSFRLPLVILTPVPLTLVGIALGHLLFGAPFTATSMIGFIALAGIIVRNSILLVDFIRHAQRPGRPLREVLIEAGRIRIKPIALTAAAAMIGAAVILTDPIFQGLALSLLFGLASSTVLTVLVIPAIYVLLRDDEPLAGDNLAATDRKSP